MALGFNKPAQEQLQPITVAARSKARNVSAHSNNEITVGSNPIGGMGISALLLYLWYPV
jgi:hypothetical protein